MVKYIFHFLKYAKRANNIVLGSTTYKCINYYINIYYKMRNQYILLCLNLKLFKFFYVIFNFKIFKTIFFNLIKNNDMDFTGN